MSVCTTCFESGLPASGEHDCPGPRFADIVFTRHRGKGITVDTAPPRTRIALQVLADRNSYIHLPTPDTIVIADQVVYRVTGYADGALELELVEDWRPAPTVQLPLTDEQTEEIKIRWEETHGNGQAVHPVVVLNEEKPDA